MLYTERNVIQLLFSNPPICLLPLTPCSTSLFTTLAAYSLRATLPIPYPVSQITSILAHPSHKQAGKDLSRCMSSTQFAFKMMINGTFALRKHLKSRLVHPYTSCSQECFSFVNFDTGDSLAGVPE
jgi:hypothetical protein